MTAARKQEPVTLVSARLRRARELLATAVTLDQWKISADTAAAFLEYVKRRDLASEVHAQAWELVQLANRGLGQLCRSLPKAKRGPKAGGIIFPEENKSKGEELKRLRLTPKKARELERLADLPEKEFRARLELGRAKITKQTEPSSMTAISAASEHDGDSWGTPEEYAEAAREVLGGIELDPASNAEAANIIRAERYYTKQDSGLVVPWNARSIWLNPPYSAKLVAEFETKFIAEFELGHFGAGITLINASTDAGWFQELLARFVVCFTRGRIAFLSHGKPIDINNRGQAFFYAGPDRAKFAAVFSRFGRVVEPFGGSRA